MGGITTFNKAAGANYGYLAGGPVGMGMDISKSGPQGFAKHQVDPLGILLPQGNGIDPVNLPTAPTVPANTAQSEADAAMQALRIQSNGGRASTTLTAANGTLSDQDKRASKTLLE